MTVSDIRSDLRASAHDPRAVEIDPERPDMRPLDPLLSHDLDRAYASEERTQTPTQTETDHSLSIIGRPNGLSSVASNQYTVLYGEHAGELLESIASSDAATLRQNPTEIMMTAVLPRSDTRNSRTLQIGRAGLRLVRALCILISQQIEQTLFGSDLRTAITLITALVTVLGGLATAALVG